LSKERSFPFGKVGFWITAGYLVFLAALVLLKWDIFQQLAPNEWGDFLAGTLGPVALIWVVLSFFLQGRELQHSVEALRLQATELKNSVDQQKEMIAVSRQAIDFERAKSENEKEARKQQIAPEFKLTSLALDAGSNLSYMVTNVGGNASSILIKDQSQSETSFSEEKAYLAKGETWTYRVVAFLSPAAMGHQIRITCLDQDGNQHKITLSTSLF
jgi:hypothetical protein